MTAGQSTNGRNPGHGNAAPCDLAQVKAGMQNVVREVINAHAPDMPPLPPIRISRRMTRTLGSYTPDRREIAISSRLVAFGTPEQVRAVLLHEMAHAIVHHRHGKAPAHGRLFKAVCREIGADGGRYVDVPVQEWTSRERFVFSCGQCGAFLVRKRATPIARCTCGARLHVTRAARVSITADGSVEKVEGYVTVREKRGRTRQSR